MNIQSEHKHFHKYPLYIISMLCYINDGDQALFYTLVTFVITNISQYELCLD